MVTVLPRSDLGFQLSYAELLLIRGAWLDALRDEFEGRRYCSVRREEEGRVMASGLVVGVISEEYVERELLAELG